MSHTYVILGQGVAVYELTGMFIETFFVALPTSVQNSTRNDYLRANW